MRASELKRAKRDIRRPVLAARDAIGDAERVTRAPRSTIGSSTLPEVRDGGVVMGFWSFGSEVATPPLIEALMLGASGSACRGSRTGISWRVAYAPGDPLGETSFGAREPADGTIIAPEVLDGSSTPGVAFDRFGHRVGYGGGFYDRFLRRTRRGVPRIAIAFDLQVLPRELPVGSFDLGVDVIVTETETIRSAPGGDGPPTSQT